MPEAVHLGRFICQIYHPDTWCNSVAICTSSFPAGGIGWPKYQTTKTNADQAATNVPVNSKIAHPSHRALPGHLTSVKLRAVRNLTQNEARPVGHLTFLTKCLSAVGSKRISQFFDLARAPRSRVIALVDSTWIFSVVVVLYSHIMEYICLCLKCYYDQILDIHFFTFSYTIGLS